MNNKEKLEGKSPEELQNCCKKRIGSKLNKKWRSSTGWKRSWGLLKMNEDLNRQMLSRKKIKLTQMRSRRKRYHNQEVIRWSRHMMGSWKISWILFKVRYRLSKWKLWKLNSIKLKILLKAMLMIKSKQNLSYVWTAKDFLFQTLFWAKKE